MHRRVKVYMSKSINSLRRHRQHLAGWPSAGRVIKTYSKRLSRMEIQSRRYNIYLCRRLDLH